ncbi:MAG: AAA family ATPase [Candidatus Dormibacteria bacterium]
MNEAQGAAPVRVVLAAPFPEIVTLHQRLAEYADRLDLCGAVLDTERAVDEVRLLGADVLVLSNRLPGVEWLPSRMRAGTPRTGVLLVHHVDGVELAAVTDSVPADATGTQLHDAVMRVLVASRDPAAAAPISGGGAEDGSDTRGVPAWYWRSESDPAPPQGWATEAAAPAPLPGVDAAAARRGPAWPPPWFEPAEEAAGGDDAVGAEDPLSGTLEPAASLPAPEPATGAEATAQGVSAVAPEEEVTQAVQPPSPSPGWAPRHTATSAHLEPLPSPAATTTVPATSEPLPPPEGPVPSPPPALAPDQELPPRRAARSLLPHPPGPPAAVPARRARGRGEAILLFSGKGGVGTSVLTTNLAVALARRGCSVAIVDLDLQYGDVAVMLHLEAYPVSIEALAQQGDQLDRETLDDVLATGPEQVRALLAPSSPEFADLVTAASVRAVFREMVRLVDFVLVDSASHLEELVLEVMELADRILLVTAYSIASVKDTKVTLKLLRSLGIQDERIGVVLNQTKPRVSYPRSDIEKSISFPALVHVPFDARVDDAIDAGAPLILTQPKCDFSRAIDLVAESLAPATAAATGEGGGKGRRFGRRR